MSPDDYFRILMDAPHKLSPEEMREWVDYLDDAAVDLRYAADDKEEKNDNPDDE